ncbi:MAG: DivIVA domain-containing protein [Clostridiales Family XIII bacterium]|jgi:cell division initiation protein|nr:DivIVA domain-containing protein [Clostridiales Family XIII bacterium]
MITPLDIQNKEFTKGVRGYKEEEVDSFLDLVTLDFEKLIQDNRRLKENISALTTEVERYRGSENAVLETLEAAKALMGDISASAEKRAEILLRNAEMDAERIQREARESVDRLTEETVNLRNRLSMLKSRFRNLLETELERFNTLSADLFPDAADEPSLMKVVEAATVPSFAGAVASAEAGADTKTFTNLRIGEGV